MIARHYPPHVSGGARRPALLAKGLRALGHDVTIVAPALPDDEPGRVVPHPSNPPLRMSSESRGLSTDTSNEPRWKRWQRDWAVWPDPDRWWADGVVRTLLADPPAPLPDLIFTTSPPESVHAAGFALSRVWNTDWIGDFRDSWLLDPLDRRKRNPVRRVLERWIARRWINAMTLACAPTEAILAELEPMAPRTPLHRMPQVSDRPGPRQEDAPHGWDAAERLGPRLLHIGSFTLSDPARTLDDTILAFADAPLDAHLFLAGRLTEDEVALCRASDRVHWLGMLSRDLALSLTLEADALVVAASPGTAAVPGKLAEYAMSGKPIIPVGEGPWRTGLQGLPTLNFADVGRTHPVLSVSNDNIVAAARELLNAWRMVG